MSTAARDITTHRQMLVAHARLRGCTILQIQDFLCKEDCVNPDTGQPWTTDTISSDLRILTRQWREAAAQDLADHKGRIFMELQEIKRYAWSASDVNSVLGALRQERELLGVDEIATVNVNVLAGQTLTEKLEEAAKRLQEQRQSQLAGAEPQALPTEQQALPAVVTQPGTPQHQVIGNKPPSL